MGECLGEQTSEPSTQHTTAGPSHQRRTLILSAVAATLALAVTLSILLQKNDNSDVAGSEDSLGLTRIETIACSTGIGIGIITRVQPGRYPEEKKVTVSVKRWLKPPDDATTSTVSFFAVPKGYGPGATFQPKQRTFFRLQDSPDRQAEIARPDVNGEHENFLDNKRTIPNQVEKARRTKCPKSWLNRDRDTSPVPGDS